MSDEPESASAEEAPISIVDTPAETPERMGARDAGKLLASLRHKREPAPSETNDAVRKEMSGDAGTPRADALEAKLESTAQADDGAPQETEAPAEQTEQAADPEPEASPIEPPRSWTKDEKERFQTLPRETQEYLAMRETERDREFRRSQNETADKLKGLTAKEQAVEQARQQYESALPQLMQTLQSQQADEFKDIQSISDVEKLARDDWPRYLQWDVAQKKLAAVQQEVQASQYRQSQEKLQKFAEFAKREDALFVERVPEMADRAKVEVLQRDAMSTLKDIGWTEEELAASWNGDMGLSMRDHRSQILIRDATLWRKAQAKAKVAVTRTVPPVQRSGVAQPRGAAKQAEIQNLYTKLDKSTGLNATRTAAQLVMARRAAR